MGGTTPRNLLEAARIIQRIAKEKTPAPRSRREVEGCYDVLVSDDRLRSTTRDLFYQGHYALAVEEAYKYINDLVKERTGSQRDGADLMKWAFSPKNPILKINDMKSKSRVSQQQGYMEILAGCMTGIRNPRAHQHKYHDDPNSALEMILLANHLVRLINSAVKTR